MKAVLEFNPPEDEEDFFIRVNAPTVAAGLSDFDRFLRDTIKHNPRKLSEVTIGHYEIIRDMLYNCVDMSEVL